MPHIGDEQYQTYQEYIDATTPLLTCRFCGSIITDGYCDNPYCEPAGEEN